MRSRADRIRHSLSFELIALAIVTPLGAWLLDMSASHVGVVTGVSALIAVGWNYIFNIGFDRALLATTGTVKKTIPQRILHAITFEAGLVAVLLPFIAWYLQVGLWEAFVMDIGFSAFYLVYAFVFNWAYDVIFPVPAPTRAG